ncbi:hypothetical protein MESS2_730248 [Mesorhizobium metallidurans STM 2683]|uniref:Transmembrane protein n=1 Tax=Mesorhizobium metallidurans STM 2683 TaxID=1297569 RepID=M5EVW7_9HYPH|nr:hypothetical protein [Mesorhizobium metallidurans]CCV08352.1 hypothetical protein MESS2_730248 [Mesorhizobium metallidurans STM 2683]
MNYIEKPTKVSNSCCGESSSVAATGDAPSKAFVASDGSLGRDILLYIRHSLRDRRVLIGIAAVVLVAAATFNWGWLVAIGVAPLLLAMAPCAAMCALGLCTMGSGKKGVPPQGSADDGAGSGLDTTRHESDTRPQ